jgi:hypothetical protein
MPRFWNRIQEQKSETLSAPWFLQLVAEGGSKSRPRFLGQQHDAEKDQSLNDLRHIYDHNEAHFTAPSEIARPRDEFREAHIDGACDFGW